MTKLFALEARLSLDDLRKRILGILIGVGGQGADGFDLADRVEPAGNAPPPALTPGL